VTQAGEKKNKDRYRAKPVGGIIYFAVNPKNQHQIKELIANTKWVFQVSAFIGVDEEGGRVSELAER